MLGCAERLKHNSVGLNIQKDCHKLQLERRLRGNHTRKTVEGLLAQVRRQNKIIVKRLYVE